MEITSLSLNQTKNSNSALTMIADSIRKYSVGVTRGSLSHREEKFMTMMKLH